MMHSKKKALAMHRAKLFGIEVFQYTFCHKPVKLIIYFMRGEFVHFIFSDPFKLMEPAVLQ